MLVKTGRKGVLSCAAALAVCGMAMSALADLPAALDRVPADAVVAVSMKDLSKLHSQFGKLKEATGMKADLGMAEQLLATPGLNKSGSAALVLMGGEAKDAEGPGPMVLVVPVSDYAEFVKAFGGSGEDKIATLTMPEEMDFEGSTQAYAKDLGGGYAAMGPVKEVIEGFDGKAGKSGDHKKSLGPVGTRVADSSETIVVANIQKLGPKIEEGLAGMKDQVGMAMAMAGPQAEQMERSMAMVEMVVKAVVRDATVTIAGLGFDEKGVTFDMGAQFKEGSPSHKLLQSKGAASKLFSKLPSSPFLFAMSVDTSAPGVKSLLKEAAAMSQPAEGAPPAMTANMMKSLETVDGVSFLMGQTPGLMAGGLLANSVMYYATKDSAAYMTSMKEMTEGMNSQKVEGMTITSTYKPAALEVSGVKVDEWGMTMQVDPNSEQAMQMQQMQMMMWGMGGGPSGYVAAVDGGVVMTMSKNQVMLGSAIDAAKGKAGEVDPLLKDVSGNLPADRTFEAYIGTKSVLDTIAGFMAMMGGGGNFQVPAQVAPVGMGGTTDSGGLQVRTYVPASVIKAGVDMSKSFGGAPEEEAPEEDGKPPRF
ncbi:MAG: hypothetical protein IT436_13820 [Phycisphaerales bacterium]|nr:hypothetical protein [Phycisphaerales bacterium]